jgi:hypothetical protein
MFRQPDRRSATAYSVVLVWRVSLCSPIVHRDGRSSAPPLPVEACTGTWYRMNLTEIGAYTNLDSSRFLLNLVNLNLNQCNVTGYSYNSSELMRIIRL